MKTELENSPTWPYVLAFAKRMEAKLAENRHKGDRENWIKDGPLSLFRRIEDEMVELSDAIGRQESLEEIIKEAADVANFAMMIADGTGELTIEPLEKRGWQPVPMPLKTITMLWDGTHILGPAAPQDEETRSAIQQRLKPTHFMTIPKAP